MMGKVYFLECAGRIKIGFSRNVMQRLRQLSTASALKFDLVGEVDGSKHLEAAIHKLLAIHRQHGEWFLDCEEVRATIAGLTSIGPSYIGFTEPPPSASREIEMLGGARVPPPIADLKLRSPLRPTLTRIDYCMERYVGDRIADAKDREVRMGLPCGVLINPIIDGHYSTERANFAISLIKETLDATEALLDASHPGRADYVSEATFYADRLERGLAKLFASPDLTIIDVSGYESAALDPMALV